MKNYSFENKLVLARSFIDKDKKRALSYYEAVFKHKIDLMTEDDFIDLALAYQDFNEIEKSFGVYLALLESFPESDRAYYGLAVLSEDLNQAQEAIKYYLKAIEKNEKYFEAHFYVAGVYDDIKDNKSAIKYYKKALELKPNHYYANLNLGSIYESINEDDEAYVFFMKALEIDYHYMALFNLGVLASKDQHDEKAIEYYEECLRLNPVYAYAYLNWSLIYKNRDQMNKAIDILTQGIEATKSTSYLYYHRACNYALIQDKEKSIKDLKVALQLYPEFAGYMDSDEDLDFIRQDINEWLKHKKSDYT